MLTNYIYKLIRVFIYYLRQTVKHFTQSCRFKQRCRFFLAILASGALASDQCSKLSKNGKRPVPSSRIPNIGWYSYYFVLATQPAWIEYRRSRQWYYLLFVKTYICTRKRLHFHAGFANQIKLYLGYGYKQWLGPAVDQNRSSYSGSPALPL